MNVIQEGLDGIRRAGYGRLPKHGTDEVLQALNGYLTGQETVAILSVEKQSFVIATIAMSITLLILIAISILSNLTDIDFFTPRLKNSAHGYQLNYRKDRNS